MKLLILGLLLFSGIAHADHLNFSFGPSVDGETNPKYFSAGWEKTFDPGSLILGCGAFFESPINVDCSAVLSARVQTPGGMFTRVGFGPAFITRTDDRLGSIFEFNIQYALGFTQNGWDIGVVGNHFSNAGLFPGFNDGRDTVSLLLEVWI